MLEAVHPATYLHLLSYPRFISSWYLLYLRVNKVDKRLFKLLLLLKKCTTSYHTSASVKSKIHASSDLIHEMIY